MKSLRYFLRGKKEGYRLMAWAAVTAWTYLGGLETAFAQCNPQGNPTRWEYTLTPTAMLNIVGQEFCTSQQQSNGCCGGPSYRCLDIIFRVENGPNGETFNTSCNGHLNLMTAQGNFDALFFSVGIPNAAGNNVSCASPISIGNNYTLSLLFNGTAGSQLSAHLQVYNAMGVPVYNAIQLVSPGQAVMLTLCKPGFGCVSDEIAFGCCTASATLALNSGAPDTLCAGQSTTLHIAGLNGQPPYRIAVRAASAADTTYFDVVVPSDGDSNSNRDTILVPIAPAQTTMYCAVSVEDGAGCVQPLLSNNKATVVVLPAPTVSAGPDQAICQGQTATLSATIGNGVSGGTWSGGIGIFSNPNALTTTYTPAPSEYGKTIALVFTANNPPGPCTSVSDTVLLTVLAPTSLTCNDKVIVALDQTGMAAVYPDMLLEMPQPNGNYLVEVFVNGLPVGNKVDCSYIGKNVVGRVTDLCTGVRCSTLIMVMDNLPPTITCADITLACAVMNYTPQALAAFGVAGAYPQVQDNCGNFTLSYIDIWQDLDCNAPYIGYALRTWTATDAQNQKSTCSQYIYFENRGLDAVQIPADVTLTCGSTAPDTSIQATGVPFVTFNGVAFPIFPPSKVGQCRLSVFYTDKIFPLCAGAYTVLREWTLLDGCRPTVQSGPNANPRTWVQRISVVDQQGPTFANCPSDLTVSTDPLNCCATASLPSVVLQDACAGARNLSATIQVRHPITGNVLETKEVSAALMSIPGSSDKRALFALTPCLPIGTHTVVYHAEDSCGNTATCSFALTVRDLMPPQVSCIEIAQVALGIDGMALVNASTFDKGSYDACGSVYFKARRTQDNSCQPTTHFVDRVKFCCEDVGDTIEVILRIYDAPPPAGPISPDTVVGNFNECIVQVYVEDKLKPICTPPAHAAVSCENFDPSLWAYGMATCSDNCCVDTIITLVNYNQFDTLCNRGTIVRIFRVVDCGGQSTTCTQRIAVHYQSSFFVRFPNDILLNECNSPFDNFGQPEFSGVDCENLGVSYEDQRFTVVPDACFKIERTWRIINWCTYNPNAGCTMVPNPNPNALNDHPSNLIGPTVSPLGTPAPWAPTNVRINPTDPQPTNFSTFWSPSPNCYQYTQVIKVRDTKPPVLQCPTTPVEVCDLSNNDPQLWNAPHWNDLLTGSHDLCEGTVDLCISAADACSGTNLKVRFLLFLDLDGDGSMETVVSSAAPPPPGVVLFGNAHTPNYSGGVPRAFDHRNVPDSRKHRFAIETNVAGQTLVACLRWNTLDAPNTYSLPELPYGTHKIKWFVDDGCGNEQVCEYTFTVKDCKAPTVVCINGLSVNLMPTKMISIDYASLVQSALDNCTPAPLLIFGIRRTGAGSGFPFLPSGNPQTSLMFDCNDLGFNLVEVWAMDLAGNADRCTTFVHVQDNIGACHNTNASVAGIIQTESAQGVEDVSVQLSIHTPQGVVGVQAATEPDGYYYAPNALPLQSDAVVQPFKNNDPLNGVSTFDLVLINRHILGLEPLGSPYKMIAADVNNNRSITTLDILELRKLILGIYQTLPDNTSWRFVERTYVFPNPSNPFETTFPEQRHLTAIDGNRLSEDFIAIKVGDVNGSAITSSLMTAQERTTSSLFFHIEDRQVRRQETFTVSFRPEAVVDGYQFTLHHEGLQLVEVRPGRGMGAEHFGVHANEQALTVSCDGVAATSGFEVVFRALEDGSLHQMLRLSNQITWVEAYRVATTATGQLAERLDIALRFSEGNAEHIGSVGFELYQNRPNPWTQRTQISFHLPADEPATLSIYDETGRICFSQTRFYTRGYHTVAIDNSDLCLQQGALFYRLETPTHAAVRRMLKM